MLHAFTIHLVYLFEFASEPKLGRAKICLLARVHYLVWGDVLYELRIHLFKVLQPAVSHGQRAVQNVSVDVLTFGAQKRIERCISG